MQYSEEKLKQVIRNYFSNKLYLVQDIPKYHLDIFYGLCYKCNIIDQPDIDRNYKHATELIFILNPEKGVLPLSFIHEKNEEKKLLNQTKTNAHYALILTLSLIDRIAAFSWNERKLSENNIEVTECKYTDVPDYAKGHLNAFRPYFDIQNVVLMNSEDLMESKMDWINDVIKTDNQYQPTFFDLLFGSYPFYAAYNL
ncbi:MAG: hypothetical protein FD123_2567 [Bacteroidetes bacterium]|nr:MAG: hypothetical protein FD123_2567 [Bacteroidota bacterium]